MDFFRGGKFFVVRDYFVDYAKTINWTNAAILYALYLYIFLFDGFSFLKFTIFTVLFFLATGFYWMLQKIDRTSDDLY